MIKEFEFYHGTALTRLIHGCSSINIAQYSAMSSNASYLINQRIGLYFKHSARRLSPWIFTFNKEHQNEIRKMKNCLSDVFIVLICGKDGIACLNYAELKYALNDNCGTDEWLKASRRTREKYAISGSDGKLRTKIGDNEFPLKIFSLL